VNFKRGREGVAKITNHCYAGTCNKARIETVAVYAVYKWESFQLHDRHLTGVQIRAMQEPRSSRQPGAWSMEHGAWSMEHGAWNPFALSRFWDET
jgi:hypothetical protein